MTARKRYEIMQTYINARKRTKEDRSEQMSEQELLTVREVAQFLRVKERTVRDMINRGELSAVKIGKAFRIRRSDLDALIQERNGGKHE